MASCGSWRARTPSEETRDGRLLDLSSKQGNDASRTDSAIARREEWRRLVRTAGLEAAPPFGEQILSLPPFTSPTTAKRHKVWLPPGLQLHCVIRFHLSLAGIS